MHLLRTWETIHLEATALGALVSDQDAAYEWFSDRVRADNDHEKLQIPPALVRALSPGNSVNLSLRVATESFRAAAAMARTPEIGGSYATPMAVVIHSAFEASVTAWWLLEDNNPEERLRRRACWAHDDCDKYLRHADFQRNSALELAEQARAAGKTIQIEGTGMEYTPDEFVASWESLIEGVDRNALTTWWRERDSPLTKGLSADERKPKVEPPGMTGILKAVDRAVNPQTGAHWARLSGIAHGRGWAYREIFSSPDLTPDLDYLQVAASVAWEVFQQAVILYLSPAGLHEFRTLRRLAFQLNTSDVPDTHA